MLKRRKIPSTLYLGLAKDEKKKDKLRAHAWLRCGSVILAGEREIDRFVVISTFGD